MLVSDAQQPGRRTHPSTLTSINTLFFYKKINDTYLFILIFFYLL
jgi:hypothetical protein